MRCLYINCMVMLLVAQQAFADEQTRILVCGEGSMDAGLVAAELTENGNPAVEVPSDFAGGGADFDFSNYDTFVVLGSIMFDLSDGCLANFPFGLEISDRITRALTEGVPPVSIPSGMEGEAPIVSSRPLSVSTYQQYNDVRVIVFLEARGRDGLESMAIRNIIEFLPMNE